MALPTALFALVASFGLATAAVLSSIDAQRGSKYDSERKNAIAAADAGASVALLRLNRFQNQLTEATPCINALGQSVPETSPGSGWCPPVPVESVGGASYVYQVIEPTECKSVYQSLNVPAFSIGDTEICATGLSGGKDSCFKNRLD